MKTKLEVSLEMLEILKKYSNGKICLKEAEKLYQAYSVGDFYFTHDFTFSDMIMTEIIKGNIEYFEDQDSFKVNEI
jgi:hypothetical protein